MSEQQPYRRESEPTFSKRPEGYHETLEMLKQPNSRPFYDTVLKYAPDTFMNVKEFGKECLKELKTIPAANPFDCIADVVHMLDHLVQAGAVESKRVDIREGHYDRLVGARIEYRRIMKSLDA
ncbi:conserved hypothetical protein [Vibrio jasicida]|uniref:Uncharacterized protein n=1 Tax=Vibrio jasicida TaxID=766224 RepID=A0AAU9QTT3_9VIBR|nr:hypothetical protein [Vibrio coralliilyticus]PAW02448.1 hypothetical protein CKJ79_17440 [Vibrio coralliilyticus]CAH1588388.1 conserved hypothetical protein [Vibrio jasicida]CAH1599831.1 conserved hypothetical protein [Vibrio jasicida]